MIAAITFFLCRSKIIYAGYSVPHEAASFVRNVGYMRHKVSYICSYATLRQK
jgi:hypothetical protein